MKKSRDDALAWRLRGHLYRRIRDSGLVPGRAELGEGLGAAAGEVDQALAFLADAHVLVLDEAGEVWMAHPFSAVETPFRVRTPRTDYWANCAWDALAIPLLLDVDGRTPTTCPQSGAPIDLSVADGRVEPADGAVVRFPVPARHFWDDIGFT
ncbi:MAG: organomercurial lyase [Gammaproteobacteria bacterium]|nr:organomercurial lyase [Gammaproteobacteria bacterium]MXW08731.1 hypothetical protein [Gammaproteobacteria bacterium]MYC52582.1 hypothetical protein [Gammaproteobacteria bacterium]